MKKKSAKSTLFYLGSLAALFGLYNSLVINSESSMSLNSVLAQKRLDEILGHIVQGRQPASEKTSLVAIPETVSPQEVKKEEIKVVTEEVPRNEGPSSIIEHLQLKLTEIQKIDTNEILTEQIAGHLIAKDGMIESLSITMQDGEVFSLENLPLSANRFIYQQNGENFHGMFFQIDTETYMVRFTDGPLKLNQLVFKKSQKEEQ